MDGLSAASGVVGLVSFGITVCQSLLKYYDSWKGAPDDIGRTYASIEELSKTLWLLKIALECKENSEITDRVRDSIKSTEESLRRLEKRLDKVRVVTLQDGWRDKAKAQFRRTLYPFKESTLVKFRELSSEARDNLSLALNLLQIDASAASLRKLDVLGQQAVSVSKGVESISGNVHNIADYTRETARILDSLTLYEKSKELRAWLSGQFDSAQKQDDMWRERSPGTGQWFFESHIFQAWLEEPSQQTPRVLNIIGKSGAGKTSLVSGAIKAGQLIGRDNPQIAVAYFYCSFDEAASQDPVHMVGSFISQISPTCPSMLEGLEVGFARNERPGLEDLEQRLKYQATRSSLKTLLFVDAVNECKNIERMIKTLLRLAESASIRVLFTSTEEDPLIAELTEIEHPKATALRMSATSADIDLYVENKIKEERNLQRLPAEIRDEIKVVLGRNADGMFRWVQCQIELLRKQSTGRLVREALRELRTSDLNSMYARIMALIPKDNQVFAREAMLWLSFAFRPLKLTELSEALAFNESDVTVDQADRLLDAHDLLRWCQGLITYDPRTSNVTLAHSSVRTYLLSDEIKQSPASSFSVNELEARRLLLRKCLTHMMFTDFASGYCSSYDEWEAFSRQWPLLNYSSQYWAAHAHNLDTELELFDQELILKFCNKVNSERGGNFGFWVQCLSPYAEIGIAQDTQPLYYAASYGLRAVVSTLISANKDMDVDALGGRAAWTALQAACHRGHYGVAKDLIDAGANPYTRDYIGRSALFLAICRGDKDTADLVRQSLRARIDPKGEAAVTHIKESFTAARSFLESTRFRQEQL